MLKFIFLFCVILLSGCAFWSSDEPKSADVMRVTVDFQSRHRCSRISPELELTGIPEGTAVFDVRLEGILEPRRLFGGGEWSNDNSGVIPEGALTRRYVGPCPGSGINAYQFVVTAKDSHGNELATRHVKVEVE